MAESTATPTTLARFRQRVRDAWPEVISDPEWGYAFIDHSDETDPDGLVDGRVFEGSIDNPLFDPPPLAGGVYALFHTDQHHLLDLLYVGKAKCLRSRIKDHCNDFAKREAGFDSWRAFPIELEGERRFVEACLIASLRPPLNKAPGEV